MFNLSDDNNKKKIERDKHTDVICDLRVHYNYVDSRQQSTAITSLIFYYIFFSVKFSLLLKHVFEQRAWSHVINATIP